MRRAVPVITAAAALAIMPSPWWPSAWVTVPAWAADKTYGTVTVAEVTSIYDGDSFRCTVAEWPPIVGERIMVRVRGIDCPEMRDQRPEVKALAQQAKQFTVERLRAAKVIELRDVGRGKYFRVLADVYVDGDSLGEALIEAGLAKPYYGGTRPEWP